MGDLTAAEIAAAWATHPVHVLDRFGSDAAVLGHVIDAEAEAPKIAASIAWMREHRHNLAPLFDDAAYHWVFKPASYRSGPEAGWQARVLQQLSCYLAGPAAEVRCPPLLGRVVPRQSLVTSYSLMSPRYWPHAGISFIVMPHAFFDFAGLIWRAFAEWCQHQSSDAASHWDAVTRALEPRPEVSRNPYLLEVIARQIAVPARDHDVNDVDAAGLIAQTVPFFHEAARVFPVDALGDFDRHVTHLLVDFTLAHEIGHILADDGKRKWTAAAYLDDEIAADRLGFAAFTASWGWRAELLEGAPFDDAAQCVLGPLFFLHTACLRSILASAVSSRLSQKVSTPVGGGMKWGPQDAERATQLMAHPTAYLHTVIQQGYRVDDGAVERLGHLARNIRQFGEAVRQVVDAIPADQMAEAHALTLSLSPTAL